MTSDKSFEAYLEEVNSSFKGWDFSYVSGTGRIQSSVLPWSYTSHLLPFLREASSLLDMGTGGGEFLSQLRPLPDRVMATEGYVPNVSIARERLKPLGIDVVEIDNDSNLPFPDHSFDLIINRHEAYAPEELKRILRTGGTFITQQVGGHEYLDFTDAFDAERSIYHNWNLKSAVEELEKAGFVIKQSKEFFPVQRFYDIGALIYYLQAIPWQVEGFEVGKFRNHLYNLHLLIEKQGFFETRQHRFLIEAGK